MSYQNFKRALDADCISADCSTAAIACCCSARLSGVRDQLDAIEDLAVLAALAGVVLDVRPPDDPLAIDEKVGAIGEEAVLVEHAVRPGDVAPEIAQEV